MSEQHDTSIARPADSTEMAPDDSFEELDDMEFLEDVDFTLDEVENKIAPLALAHR